MNEYTPAEAIDDQHAGHPLARVRYGLAKEIVLFPDSLIFIAREEGEEDCHLLKNIHSIAIMPGDKVPSKLLVVIEIDDGKHIIAAEGMTNVRDFVVMLPLLQKHAPHIRLDPPDMIEQLNQAVQNRRESNLGCYAIFFATIIIIGIVLVAANILHTFLAH